MNPLSLIKEGIKDMDWEKIVRGYNTITGDTMVAPTPNDEDVTLPGIRMVIADELGKREVVIVPSVLSVSDEISTDQLETTPESDVGKDSMVDTKSGEFTGQLITKKSDVVGHFGNVVHHITGEADETMVKHNKAKAARAKITKTKRPPPRKFLVKCNQCQQEFESDRKADEMGEKCPKCLSGMRG